MPETEAITVTFDANTGDLVEGVRQGETALRSFGKTSDSVRGSIREVAADSKGLFRALIEMRIAAMSVERVMKDVGFQNEFVTRTFQIMNTAMDVAITLTAIYRAAKIAQGLAHWFTAKAALAESAGMAGTISFGVGVAIMAAAGLAAFAAVEAFAPRMGRGGIVMPSAAGTVIRAAEAGYPEAIIPLNRAGDFGLGGDVHVTMNVYSNNPDEISRTLGRRIQQVKMAGW